MAKKKDLDIVNEIVSKKPSTTDNQETETTLSRIRNRIIKMRGAALPFKEQWELNQDQTESRSYEDQDKFYPNVKIEQSVIEMRLGGRAGDIIINVEPDTFEPNVGEAEISKHILYKFMHEEQFYWQLRMWRHDKSITGTGVFWTGLTHEMICKIERKKVKVKPQIGNGFFDKKGKVKVFEEKRYFMPQNVPLNSFLIDESCLNQPDFKKANDCVRFEFGTKEEILNRRKNVPGVDEEALNALEPITEQDPPYGMPTPYGQVCLANYYNKNTKEWTIIGNDKFVIMESEYEYECDGLPFVVCQHHPRNDCIYGIGEPEVMAALKAVMNASWQAIISGSLLGSGKLLLAGNSGDITDSIDSQTRVYSGEVNMKEVTNSVEQYKEIDTRVDLGGPVQVLELVNEAIKVVTGQDVDSPFKVPEQNLGQTEIKEENKSIRAKSVDELEDFAIGEALTIALNNCIKFAPSLRKSKKKIGYNGKITEIKSDYTLSLPNITIKTKDDGTSYVEEDLGSYGEVKFTDDLINGYVKVRVVTASTSNSKLTVLEKNKIKEFVANLETVASIYGVDAVIERVPLDFLWNKIMHAYGYGDKDTEVKSDKQITKDKNAKMIQAMKELDQYFTQLQQDATTAPVAEPGLQQNVPGPTSPAPVRAGGAPEGVPAVLGGGDGLEGAVAE